VVAYATARRTHEIGIRMALGASRTDALKMVLGTGMRVVSLILSRLLASQLWRVSAHDPTTITCVASLLLTTGALACWIPARRATAIEPTMALRHE
jgi:putative ABC transport system permease protein